MTMKLRWHELSMPSRSVAWYLQYIGKECELVPVKLFEGEQKSEEYTNKHPMGQFPALEEGDFFLSESSAILQYLAEGRSELPTDRAERAALEEYITAHHTTVRLLSSECFAHAAYIKENASATHEEREPILASRVPLIAPILKYYDHILSKQDYICGEKLTIADFLFCCEVDELHIFNILAPYKGLKEYVRRMSKTEGYHDNWSAFTGALKNFVPHLKEKPFDDEA